MHAPHRSIRLQWSHKSTRTGYPQKHKKSQKQKQKQKLITSHPDTQLRRANDLDRGLGKVRLYADSTLPPQHKNREGETQASGVADTADETEARSKRFIIIICRPQIHATHRSIRLRWSRKSTRFRPRLALGPGASHKTNKQTKNK